MNFLNDNIAIHEKIRIIKMRIEAMEEMIDLNVIMERTAKPPSP